MQAEKVPASTRKGRLRAVLLLAAICGTAAALVARGSLSTQKSKGSRSAATQAAEGQTAPHALSNDEAQAMVRRVLHVEMDAAQQGPLAHPMQYKLRKTSPRISTTKLIVETKDGDVARLIAINNEPLSADDEKKEDARLQGLLDDPSQQQHRQQREQGDTDRARKVIRALPDAFIYTYAGFVDTPQGPCYKLSFQPNSAFNPQDLEAQVLKGMAGELWIDVVQQRVTRLQGKRIHSVEYGWGVLGKLDEGGTLLLEQANVGDHQWRTTHMVLVMNGRVLFRSVKLDTTLELSDFAPIATGLPYQKAIQILRESPAAGSSSLPAKLASDSSAKR